MTLGTMVATDDVLRPVIDGVASLDVDVLVALGSAAGTGISGLSPNVHVEGFVDQAGVLEVADLVVHHGGSGTVLAALAAGVPQLVIPTGADQFVNADRLADTGLASVLPRPTPRPTPSPRRLTWPWSTPTGQRYKWFAPRSQPCPTRPRSSTRCHALQLTAVWSPGR